MPSKKRYIVLLSLLILISALWYTFASDRQTANQNFSYDSLQPQIKYVQITTGQSKIVPFAFDIEIDVSEIRLELEDQVLQKKGVTLEDTMVPVRNGKASSRVVFGFPSQKAISPGTYYLNIRALDNTSGKVLHSGEIPFIVDMDEIIGGCSC